MATISEGPVELVALAVPDPLPPDLITELFAASGNDAVRLLDLVLLTKSDDGVVEVREVDDLRTGVTITDFVFKGSGLTGHEDLDVIASALPAGTAAVVLLIENLWAAGIAEALEKVGGGVVASEWLPASLVNQLADELT